MYDDTADALALALGPFNQKPFKQEFNMKSPLDKLKEDISKDRNRGTRDSVIVNARALHELMEDYERLDAQAREAYRKKQDMHMAIGNKHNLLEQIKGLVKHAYGNTCKVFMDENLLDGVFKIRVRDTIADFEFTPDFLQETPSLGVLLTISKQIKEQKGL
jgi:hypothetical protein